MVLVIYVDSDIFMFVNIHEKKLWSKDYVEQGKNISPYTYKCICIKMPAKSNVIVFKITSKVIL